MQSVKSFTECQNIFFFSISECDTETPDCRAWNGAHLATCVTATTSPSRIPSLPPGFRHRNIKTSQAQRFCRALPNHVSRFRLPILRGVRRTETRWQGKTVRSSRPSVQSSEKSFHKYLTLRPLQGEAPALRRRRRQRLHQRQLRARLQLATGVHCDARPTPFDSGWLLEDVLGNKFQSYCHVDGKIYLLW